MCYNLYYTVDNVFGPTRCVTRVDQDLLVDIDSLVSRSRLPGDHHHLNTHGLLCVGK